MITNTAEGLRSELDNATTYFKNALEYLPEKRWRFHGPFFMPGNVVGRNPNEMGADPENHAYEMARLMVPRFVGQPPNIEFDTNRPEHEQRIVQALEWATNKWVVDTRIHTAVRPLLAVDYLLMWGVSVVTLQPRPGISAKLGDKVYWPAMRRISMRDFMFDPLAQSIYEARWTAHRIVRDKEDLLREAREHPERGWDLQAIVAMPENTAVDELERDERVRVDRRELTYWVIRVAEHQLDGFSPSDGFNGTVYTLGVGNTSDGDRGQATSAFLRRAVPFYGPPWGAHQLYGYMPIPDVPLALSSTTAVESQVRELNALVRAQSRSDRAYKRMVLVDSKHPQLHQILKSGRHDFVIPVRGLGDGEVLSLEVAGSTDQMLRGIQLAKDRVDRMSGKGSAQRGFVSGEGTATENSIAQEASETSVQYEIERFRQSEEMAYWTAAWYIYHSDEVRIPLGSEAASAFGVPDPVYVGGFDGDRFGTKLDFESLNLRIRATPEGVQRVQRMELLNLAASIAPAMPQTPWLDWRRWATAVGQANRFEEFPGLFNWQLLGLLTQLGMTADPLAMGPRMGTDTPRHGGMGPGQRTMAIPGSRPTMSGAMARGGSPAGAGGGQAGGGNTRSFARQNGSPGPARAGGGARTPQRLGGGGGRRMGGGGG